jgi:hypothetical protein
LYLSWARPIQSAPPHPISPRSILILSTHQRLGHHSGLFPSGFPTNNLYIFLFFHMLATCPTHLILIGLIILIILEENKLQSSSLYCFLHPRIISSLFGPNILISLCSSLNVRDQVSHPYRTTGKIIVLYVLIFMFFDSRKEDRWFWTKW